MQKKQLHVATPVSLSLVFHKSSIKHVIVDFTLILFTLSAMHLNTYKMTFLDFYNILAPFPLVWHEVYRF